MPLTDFKKLGTQSEKAVQKIRMVGGDVPNQFIGFSPPEQSTNRDLEQVRTVGNGPFVSFVFKSRSTSKFPQYRARLATNKTHFLEALKDLNIIPSTLVPTPPRSPTPLYNRNLREMTEEQRIQALMHFQQSQQALKMRIKREDNESAETIVENHITRSSGAKRSQRNDKRHFLPWSMTWWSWTNKSASR
jgi:hypothetical protein